MSRYIVSRLLLISAFGACAWAQIQSGRITGTVFDPNKAVIPNASVTVTETATNVARQTTTNGSGAYVVPALNPGIYTMSVTAPGFGRHRAFRRRDASRQGPAARCGSHYR